MDTRKKLYSLLGDLPPLDNPISADTAYAEERKNYTLEKLTLNLNGTEAVPAYFVKPKTGDKKFPTVLFCHSHGGKYDRGKEELVQGNTYLTNPPYAESLTELGLAALCIDSPLFGERSGRDELDYYKETILQGKVLWGLMVYDHLRALDYLHTRPDVDPSRLATLGMSMGSLMAWWIAALDERIKVCTDICCMVDYHTLLKKGLLKKHGIYFYIPKLLKYFDTSSINALIAPRYHLSVNGSQDELAPLEGLDVIDTTLKHIYKELGAPEAWQLKKYPAGHEETTDMRKDILKFLTTNL
ncbi:MAG: alpha/beta hydrolase [Turicibacter sp.]|nr:alpha/beta hydrolase [Turicibacter sp.]